MPILEGTGGTPPPSQTARSGPVASSGRSSVIGGVAGRIGGGTTTTSGSSSYGGGSGGGGYAGGGGGGGGVAGGATAVPSGGVAATATRAIVDAQVRQMYADMFGAKSVPQSELDHWWKVYSQGVKDISGIRHELAFSGRAVAHLTTIYRSELGREPQTAGMAHWQRYLAQGKTMSWVRQEIGNTPEANRRNQQLRREDAEAKAAQAAADAELAQRQSAHAVIKMTLEQYGLGDLADWAWGRLTDKASSAEVMLELRNQEAFKTRFKAITMRQDLGLNPVSPEDVINYETQARDMLRSAGLPSTFYDHYEDFSDLIGKGVSLQSLNTRVEESWNRVVNAPAEVRQAWEHIYGNSSDAALAAFFFDPDQNEQKLKTMAQTAVAGGAMTAFNFDIDLDAAARVAGLDLNDLAVSQGFSQLSRIRNVFNETFGETDDIDEYQEGVNAVFDMGAGAEAIEQRIATRRAQFGGGQGGALMTRLGLAGTAPN